MTDLQKHVEELAALDPFEYEGRRKSTAKSFGVRVSALDQAVEDARNARQGTASRANDAAGLVEDVVPWDDPVDGAELLEEIRSSVNRFCVLPEHSDILIAAWILHAHAHDTATVSPILCLTSPEKRCGKTTTAMVIRSLVPRPLHLANVSTAALYRVIEQGKPTLIIDEGDSFLKHNEGMRNLLNAGHERRSAHVLRCTGDDHEPRKFSVWAPKVLAMIGRPADTIVDRSILVSVRRRLPGEVVERFSLHSPGVFEPIARRAGRWARDNATRLSQSDPEVPEQLDDRARDNARPLLAIAELAGGHWPATVRAALSSAARRSLEEEPASPRILLLTKFQKHFLETGDPAIRSSDFHSLLVREEDGPWADWQGGRPISTRGVALLLKEFGIRTQLRRDGRFYVASDFRDAFKRYLPPVSENASHASQTSPPE